MLNKYQQLVATTKGKLILLAVDVVVAYAIISLAIETGNILYYILFFILVLDAINLVIKLVRPKSTIKKHAKTTHATKRTKKTA